MIPAAQQSPSLPRGNTYHPYMMHRHASYPYPSPPMATAHHRYGTSSAFSASANPNEDWTKISDLAERRRIQNRIAQRNYRKKLKKRLEDLERRAASNSASPEPKPAEIAKPKAQPQRNTQETTPKLATPPRKTEMNRRASDMTGFHSYPTPASHDDRATMFTHQYTRQLSTSPPPFSFANYPASDLPAFQPFSQPANQYSMSTAISPIATPVAAAAPDMTAYQQYLPPLASSPFQFHANDNPIKQEFYGEEEISPFSLSYASVAGIDIPQSHHSYHDSNVHTPPLSESFEHSTADSPPDSLSHFPTTPSSLPGTPPLLKL